MNRFVLFLCAVFIAGCHTPVSENVVAKVNNTFITQQEFEEAYKNSSGVQSKQDFLNNMINQKLILLDAESRGLDKNKEFLKMIENFWQQSLLTMALKEKSDEGANLEQWVESLRKNSNVVINEELLK